LRRFEPVTIKMAKEQQLFLNPAKISGVCGRLLCCLSFEKEAYADFQRRCPKVGKYYETSWGRVKVLRANLLRDSLLLYAPWGEEKEISLDEWQEIAAG
jgi:cell fate regulator YaaT (PSP1 superfamily)